MTRDEALDVFSGSEYNGGYRHGWTAARKAAIEAIRSDAGQAFMDGDDTKARMLRDLSERLGARLSEEEPKGYSHDDQRRAEAAAALLSGE